MWLGIKVMLGSEKWKVKSDGSEAHAKNFGKVYRLQ